MSGLVNRFPEEVRHQWHFWYDCIVCGMNGFDALHHIISPTVKHYEKGGHNRSVYNSCPIHNQNRNDGQEFCHIGNDDYLHRDDILIKILGAVKEALDGMGYQPNDNDKEFLRVYAHLYPKRESGRNPAINF